VEKKYVLDCHLEKFVKKSRQKSHEQSSERFILLLEAINRSKVHGQITHLIRLGKEKTD